ncbi:WhiB family transcriptional regulator [Tersicoccus sp. Bi-70]|uniref:WhiB family transcriptional regulator n=1 Tax=Tersicoccus sp. Bi-70 TaxID=1897634 RepID=UPI00097870CE|nr:WhiB family transcriptional regulator [Tersicoccus sp. Bi-70]
MGAAEQAQERYLAADTASRHGARAVPDDWYVDPADPDASRRYREHTQRSLEDAATAFLAEHEALEESGVTALAGAPAAAPQHTEHAYDHQVSPAIWLGLPGTSPDPADDGELSWQADALCAQTDPEAFFPEKGGSTRDAKKVCGACTVRSQCLQYALENDERFGIWGGMSERERRRLRRRAV